MHRVNTINYATPEDATLGRNPLAEPSPAPKPRAVRCQSCETEVRSRHSLPMSCPVCDHALGGKGGHDPNEARASIQPERTSS